MCGYEASLRALPRLRFVYVLFTIADSEGTCGQLPVDARFTNAQLCLARSLSVLLSRTLQVSGGCISFPQRPGSFYVGNLCALSHNVVHGEHAAGSYGGARSRSRCKSLLCCEPTFSERREPAQLMPHQGLRSYSKS